MQIPDFEILWKSGCGASGEVWIARNRAGSLVALKTIEKSEQAAGELAGLRSYFLIAGTPHLIRIFHIGEVDNILYYTMELADNLGTNERYIPATLDNLLRQKKRLSPAETAQLGRKLLDGLETLHQNRLIHRDIKPENILFVGGKPKLSDIGLIRSVSHSLGIGGTLGFIPPERLKAGTGAMSSADDLFALGKVLYCCLTGNDVEEYPVFPHSLLRPEYSQLNKVILTACNRDPAKRFRSAAEFSRALGRGAIGKRRLLPSFFRGRYLGFWLGAVIAFSCIWQRLTPEVVSSETGHVPSALAGDEFSPAENVPPGGSNYLEPTFSQASPDPFESILRHREMIPDSFSEKDWKLLSSKNLQLSNKTLRGWPDARGGVRLLLPLDYSYAIRFQIDYGRLDGLLIFRSSIWNPNGSEDSFIQWSLLRTQEHFTLNPLEFQEENGKRRILIHPVKQPRKTPGFHRVEMVQTTRMFGLYIDGELLLYAPGFFCGGYFTLFAVGGKSNFFELKNFELWHMSHLPGGLSTDPYWLTAGR